MTTRFKTYHQEKSANAFLRIVEELKLTRFRLGTHNQDRLAKSLSLYNKLSLKNITLLDPDVHAVHYNRLYELYMKEWRRLSSTCSSSSDLTSLDAQRRIMHNHCRFVTIIHEVTALSSIDALISGKGLRDKLTSAARSLRGMKILGAIEVEVISLKLMRRLEYLTDGGQSEQRKYEACKLLAEMNLGELYKNDSSLMLVHFHGLATAKNEVEFDHLDLVLRDNPGWHIAPRQIQIKRLSEEFAGRQKTIEDNLLHIARYITKGGNDWYGGKAYLRYKIAFDNTMPLSLEEWEQLNWRKYPELRAEHSMDGIMDELSLNPEEICSLAEVIDGLMGSNASRTGYLVKIGNW